VSKTTMLASAPVSDVPAADSRGVVARYFRIWNEGDPTTVSHLIASDWVDHAHPERRTRVEVEEAITEFRLAEPDTHILVDALLGDGGLVTVHGRIERPGHTENRVWIVRIEDDRMREMWTYLAD
jgi:predicted SnoaL-like aldol condensation-catalyzing enzyme